MSMVTRIDIVFILKKVLASIVEGLAISFSFEATSRCLIPGCGCVRKLYWNDEHRNQVGHEKEKHAAGAVEQDYLIWESDTCRLGCLPKHIERIRTDVEYRTRYDRPKSLAGLDLCLQKLHQRNRYATRSQIYERFNEDVSRQEKWSRDFLDDQDGLFLHLPKPKPPITKIHPDPEVQRASLFFKNLIQHYDQLFKLCCILMNFENRDQLISIQFSQPS